MTEKKPRTPQAGEPEIRPPLPPAAQRALEEARLRREAETAPHTPAEVNGPKGPEPTRYGDWERNGIASDF